MKKRYQVNSSIRVPKLRVIKSDGENLGEMSTKDAQNLAHKENLDLVVIAESAKPPVAKILDFNKYLYEERKKTSATKAKSKKSELKEFRFGPNIGEGDLNNRIERAKGFIEGNNRVRVTVKLRGRERALPEVAFKKIEIMKEALKDVGVLEGKPKLMGNAVRATFHHV